MAHFFLFNLYFLCVLLYLPHPHSSIPSSLSLLNFIVVKVHMLALGLCRRISHSLSKQLKYERSTYPGTGTGYYTTYKHNLAFELENSSRFSLYTKICNLYNAIRISFSISSRTHWWRAEMESSKCFFFMLVSWRPIVHPKPSRNK